MKVNMGSYHGSGFHTLGSPYLWYEFHPDRRVTAQDVPSLAGARLVVEFGLARTFLQVEVHDG